MRSKIAVFVVAAMSAVALVAQAQEHKPPVIKSAGLERFKQLAGEWTGKGMMEGKEQEVHIAYKVTSGGSAVQETFGPNSPHEMITMIHPDGDTLLLTHYCMLGNQPHMRATPKDGDNKVAFQFVKATNMKSDKDPHMHSVTYTFVDKDTIKAEWTAYMDGKEAHKTEVELKRKK